MPWALLAAVFFVDVGIWILTGFLRINYSLSVSFFATFYGLLGITAVRLAWSPQKLTQQVEPNRTFTRLGWIWFWVVLLAWGGNAISSDQPAKATLFNLLIPLSLAAAHLAVWGTPWNDRTWVRLGRVFGIVLGIDMVVSVLTIWLVNVTQTIPSLAFFLNPRYPVILFPLAGRLMVRTPGIFESGGTNGSFLLLAAGLCASYTLLAPSSRRSKAAALAALVGLGLLVVGTLTRRSIAGLITLIAVIGGMSALIKRRYILTSLVFLTAIGAVGLVAYVFPSLFEARSLVQRIDFWSENLETLVGTMPWRLFTGYGQLQSSVEFTQTSGLALLDNGALGLLVYGGVLYFLVVVWYYAELFRLNVRLVRSLDAGSRWLAVTNVGLLSAMLVIASFSIFVTNITEAFPLMIGSNLLTRSLLERTRMGPSSANG